MKNLVMVVLIGLLSGSISCARHTLNFSSKIDTKIKVPNNLVLLDQKPWKAKDKTTGVQFLKYKVVNPSDFYVRVGVSGVHGALTAPPKGESEEFWLAIGQLVVWVTTYYQDGSFQKKVYSSPEEKEVVKEGSQPNCYNGRYYGHLRVTHYRGSW